MSGKLIQDELEDVEKEFEKMFRIELPDVPDDELEAAKEEAGLPAKTSLFLFIRWTPFSIFRTTERTSSGCCKLNMTQITVPYRDNFFDPSILGGFYLLDQNKGRIF